MKKSIKNVISGLALALVATATFAAGDSWVSGGVNAGASVINGAGGFSAGYQGGAGTMSWTGGTQVQTTGGTSGDMMGHMGTVNGIAQSGASAHQFGGYSSSDSGSMTGSFAGVMNGTAMSGAQAGSGGSANSSWF